MSPELALHYAVGSDVGLHREGNEDAAYAGARLLAVADGMGGHAAGEVASAAVIAALRPLDSISGDDADVLGRLRLALQDANRELRTMVERDPSLEGMGTTITAFLFDGARLGLAHIGDSRAYLFRDGELSQLTHDHTFVQQLVDDGRLSADGAERHPQRSLLTRALDGRESLEPDLVIHEGVLGDRFLLCSDGLSGVVPPALIAEALEEGSPEDAVARLIALALERGAPDNVTCIVADVVDAAAVPATLGVAAGAAGVGDAVPANPPATHAPAAVANDVPPAAEADRPDVGRHVRHVRRRRRSLVVLAVIALLAIGAVVGWTYIHRQYYVGAAGSEVVIFRGVDATLLGIDLSEVHTHTGLQVTALPAFEQGKVRSGITASDLTDARAIITRLRAELAQEQSPVCPTPTPTPTATPRVQKPTARPRTSASPSKTAPDQVPQTSPAATPTVAPCPTSTGVS